MQQYEHGDRHVCEAIEQCSIEGLMQEAAAMDYRGLYMMLPSIVEEADTHLNSHAPIIGGLEGWHTEGFHQQCCIVQPVFLQFAGAMTPGSTAHKYPQPQ